MTVFGFAALQGFPVTDYGIERPDSRALRRKGVMG
jgi:hypothetical protein